MASFPGSAVVFPARTDGQTIFAQHINAIQDEVAAVESSLLAGQFTGTGVPTGSIVAFGGTAAPTGYLLCNGAAVSRSTYSALFAVLAVAYGSGDGSSTFNLPNLQQRFPLGKAASGTGVTLGGTGGLIDHTHTVPGLSVPGLSSPAHSIPSLTVNVTSLTASAAVSGTSGAPVGTMSVQTGTGLTTTSTSHTHTFSDTSPVTGTGTGNTTASSTGTATTGTGTTGTGTSGLNNPPFQVVNYIIKT